MMEFSPGTLRMEAINRGVIRIETPQYRPDSEPNHLYALKYM